jgi:hypothetical protein
VGTPRKAMSPTIAERHREARQRQQQVLTRVRNDNALRFADAVLHDESMPITRTLDEFRVGTLETSFTSTVKQLSAADKLINRTYDLDLNNSNDYDIDDHVSDRSNIRPMSATTSNFNQSAISSTSSLRPASTSSIRRSRPMTSMGKAIIQV